MEQRIPVHLIQLTFAGCGFEKWVENGPDQIQHLAYTHVGYSAAAVANYLSVFCMPWPLGLLLIKGWHGKTVLFKRKWAQVTAMITCVIKSLLCYNYIILCWCVSPLCILLIMNWLFLMWMFTCGAFVFLRNSSIIMVFACSNTAVCPLFTTTCKI